MEWGYWSRLVGAGGGDSARERNMERRDGVAEGLAGLSLMERSRRVGVVSMGYDGKRRLSPLSPDSALGSGSGSDDEASKSQRTEEDLEESYDYEEPVAKLGSRQFRTPSVVISDYSEEPPESASVTLEDIERIQQQRLGQHHPLASSTSISPASSWGSWNSPFEDNISLRPTPSRKISECSTCSTLSGDEDFTQPVLLQRVNITKKVSAAYFFDHVIT